MCFIEKIKEETNKAIILIEENLPVELVKEIWMFWIEGLRYRLEETKKIEEMERIYGADYLERKYLDLLEEERRV